MSDTYQIIIDLIHNTKCESCPDYTIVEINNQQDMLLFDILNYHHMFYETYEGYIILSHEVADWLFDLDNIEDMSSAVSYYKNLHSINTLFDNISIHNTNYIQSTPDVMIDDKS